MSPFILGHSHKLESHVCTCQHLHQVCAPAITPVIILDQNTDFLGT